MAISKQYRIGIDVGGTKMTSVLVDKGRTLSDFTLATPKDNLEHFLIMLKALLDPLFEMAKTNRAKIASIGIGIPGMISADKTKILKCPNLSLLDGISLPTMLKEKFDLDCSMDNDANCFIRAEATLGAGQKFSNIYGITIGTGIGGGWWVDGGIYSGVHGGGAEPGHMIVDYKEMTDLEDVYHKLTEFNPGDLARRAYLGDGRAQGIFEELGKLFGAGFANVVNVLDPDLIVVGGGVVESSELFLNTAKKIMKENIVSPGSRNIKIAKAKLGALSGAIGASLLGQDTK